MAGKDALFCLMTMAMLLKYSIASGKFELQVLKVENTRNEKANGECCDSSGVRDGEESVLSLVSPV